MATKISWCDETINPIVGCSKISAGCQNCYALDMAYRLRAMGQVDYQIVTIGGGVHKWGGDARFRPEQLKKPYKWRKPRSIFVGSMGDLFLKTVPFEWIDEVMRMVWENKQHIFIFLTKRPDRMLEYFKGLATPGTHTETAKRLLDRLNYTHYDHGWHMRYLTGGSLENLVLGVSVEDQQTADERIPALISIPAGTRFISLEPMIGPVELDRLPRLDGVILGGESGSKGRRMEPLWVMAVRDQCVESGVPFMFKQWNHENRNEVDETTGFPWLGNRTHSALAW